MKRVANTLRVTVAVVFYTLWPLQHVYLLVTGQFSLYGRFFDQSYLPFYPWAWHAVGEPLLPWSLMLVIVFEYTAAALMLNRGRAARLGQIAGLAWNLLLAPFPWGYTNLILAALHGWLATRTFERAALPFGRRRSSVAGRAPSPVRRHP